MWQRLIQFLQEVKAELFKVTWPTRDQVQSATVAVLILVILVAVFIGVTDLLLSKFFGLIFGL